MPPKAIKAAKTPSPEIYRLLPQKSINKMANKQAAAALKAAQAPVLQQEAADDARAAAARQAMAGFGTAAASMLSGVGAANAKAYQDAVGETQGLTSSLSGQLGQQMTQEQAANDNFQQQMAPGSSSQEQVNPTDAANAVQDLGAVIPGSSLAAQGAAETSLGNEQQVLPLAQSAADQAASVGSQNTTDQGYAQQLLSLAAAEPANRDQILQTLYGNEAQKAQAIQSRQAEQLSAQQLGLSTKVDNANIKHQQAEDTARFEGLQLSNQRQELAVKKYQSEGHRIDSSGSKVRGYVVDDQGRFVRTANGHRIPVKNTTQQTATHHAYQSAVGYSQEHFTGTPDPNPAYVAGVSPPGTGQYLGKNGKPTNNPRQARTTYEQTFVQAQNYLQQRYGLNKKQARRALVSLGRKPDGKRPPK